MPPPMSLAAVVYKRDRLYVNPRSSFAAPQLGLLAICFAYSRRCSIEWRVARRAALPILGTRTWSLPRLSKIGFETASQFQQRRLASGLYQFAAKMLPPEWHGEAS